MFTMFAVIISLLAAAPATPPVNPFATQEDLESFIARVIEKRAENWDRLYDFVFREHDRISFSGTLDLPDLDSFDAEFAWYVKDGYQVRSPVTFNGAEVSDAEREKAEREWIERQEKRKGESRNADRDQFFGFRFKEGNWLLAGQREVPGVGKVIVAEFYPSAKKETDPDDDEEERKIEEAMRKTTMVTLEILPESCQIVTMTMHNTGLEFLPIRWLVRVSNVQSQLVMREIAPGVWGPKEITGGGRISTADGDINVRFLSEYSDYKRTAVKVKFKFEPMEREDSENKEKP